MQENLISLLKTTIKYYNQKNIKKSIIEAIFSDILKLNRLELYTNFNREITEDEKQQLKKALKKIENINEMNIDTDTIKDLLDKSIKYLQKNNIDEAKLKAELIFSNILEIDRMNLFIHYNKKIEENKKNKIREYLQQVGENKIPISYLFNEKEFYGYKFYVDNSVLIPRNDTEVLVNEVLKVAKNNDKILDIGCGSGAIGISIGLEIPTTKILCTDISDKCINVATINKNNLKAKNVSIKQSDLFENITYKEFDIIVSNPPYIDILEEVEEMSEDTIHEPQLALFAAEEGFYFYHKISEIGRNHLKNGGYIFFEIGYKQADRVQNILFNYGYSDIEVIKDLNKNDRVIKARYINESK